MMEHLLLEEGRGEMFRTNENSYWEVRNARYLEDGRIQGKTLDQS